MSSLPSSQGPYGLFVDFLSRGSQLAVPPAGKKFFQKKKQPIPVDLTSKDWAGQVRKATEATYMFHTGGTSLSIR